MDQLLIYNILVFKSYVVGTLPSTLNSSCLSYANCTFSLFIYGVYVSHHKYTSVVLCSIKINLPMQVGYLHYNISARLKHVYFVELRSVNILSYFRAIHTFVALYSIL